MNDALARVQIEMCVYRRFRSFNLNFRNMASRTYADRHTHASCSACSPASVGLAQARLN